jgi:hypothetical protein
MVRDTYEAEAVRDRGGSFGVSCIERDDQKWDYVARRWLTTTLLDGHPHTATRSTII